MLASAEIRGKMEAEAQTVRGRWQPPGSHVEAHPCLSEQRISLPLQRADHWPDTPALDQPVSVSCIPLSACSSQECIKLAGTTHDDLAALFADLARPDMRREVDCPRHQSFSGRSAA
jgi:hypothetical protein